MIDDLGACDDWLYAALGGDTALSLLVGDRVFPDLAPQDTPTPFLIYSQQGGEDDDTLGDELSLAVNVYLVRVVGTGDSYAPLRPIMKRVHALLQGQGPTVTDVDGDTAHLACRRLRPRRYSEFTDNVRYNHYGAEYRITVQPVT